jgi:hypothetical protein
MKVWKFNPMKERLQNSPRNKDMDGLYLYCIREKSKNPSPFRKRGIDGRNDVFTIIHRELEAVVSKVFLSEFASEEVQKKAREDLGWIKEKAVIHEDVIEEAMRGADGPVGVIPMRFGIIFNDKAGLKEILDKDYAKMRRLLNGIQGKQEWGVKVYLMDGERFELIVREHNEDIRLKEREMASMPEGMAYFMEEELKEMIRDEENEELDAIVDHLFRTLGEEATKSAKSKNLDREITGRTERMVFNAAFLVHGDKVDSFKKALEKTDKEINAKGLHLEFSGPWPPFNFAQLEGGEPT